jgi:hypothetical protein
MVRSLMQASIAYHGVEFLIWVTHYIGGGFRYFDIVHSKKTPLYRGVGYRTDFEIRQIKFRSEGSLSAPESDQEGHLESEC